MRRGLAVTEGIGSSGKAPKGGARTGWAAKAGTEKDRTEGNGSKGGHWFG